MSIQDEVNFSSEIEMDAQWNPVKTEEADDFVATPPESANPGTNTESTDATKPAVKTAQELADNIAKHNRQLQDQAHLNALETIWVVFSKYSHEEQKEFFESRPELSKVADSSKKYKQQFRNLNKETKETNEVKEIDAEKFKEEIMADFKENTLKDARQQKALELAVKEGLDEEKATQLLKRAEALYSTDVDYDVALEAAKVSLGIKSSGVNNLPSSSNLSNDNVVDAKAEIKRIMKESVVDNKTAEKIYNHFSSQAKKGVSFDLSKGFYEAPMD